MITYECTTVGIGTTVWQGSAFDCRSRTISLRHSQFNGTGRIIGVCGTALSAFELSSVNFSFTSQLNVSVSEIVVSDTVQCAYDNGKTSTVIGTDTITLSTGKN